MEDLQYVIARMQRARDLAEPTHFTNQAGYDAGNPDDALGLSSPAEPVPDEGPVGLMGPEVGPVGSFTTPGLEVYEEPAAEGFDGTTVDPTGNGGLDFTASAFEYRDDTATYDADTAAN